MRRSFGSLGGFTLAEMILVGLVFVVAWVICLAIGWGLVFTFVSTVLVPWLGVPVAYQHLAILGLTLVLGGGGCAAAAAMLVAALGGIVVLFVRLFQRR